MTHWRYVALSIGSTACSVLSKEQGVTAAGVCVACDVLLNWGDVAKWVAAQGRTGAAWDDVTTKNAAASGTKTIGSDEQVRGIGHAALKRIGEPHYPRHALVFRLTCEIDYRVSFVRRGHTRRCCDGDRTAFVFPNIHELRNTAYI